MPHAKIVSSNLKTTMERAGRLLGKLKIHANSVSPEELARAAWPSAVGKKIAAHANAVSLVRTCLIIEVEDALWQRQLNTLRGQILKRIQDLVGSALVADIAFRPMTPKRMPERAESSRQTPAHIPDDADRIADPILRSVYKTSRKKANA
jgi:hypothetical protein